MRNDLRTLGRRALAGMTRNPMLSRAAQVLSRRGYLPEAIWKRLPVERAFVVDLGEGQKFLYHSTLPDGIGRGMYWRGSNNEWSAATVDVFRSIASKSRTVLDIGANTGLYSLIACASNDTSEVLAFEPVPRVFDLLSRNIHGNDFGERCRPYQTAVSDVEGQTRFHVPNGNVPLSASLNQAGFRDLPGELIEVPTTTVDAIARNVGLIDLCKIDVEGYELQVMQGMATTMLESAPAIVFECNSDGPGEWIRILLKENGYRIYHLGQRGPVSVEMIATDKADIYTNYIAVKRQEHVGIIEGSMSQ